MENASKALIIAGAILISILIIGLGVFIYNKAKGAMDDSIGLDEQKISSVNQKFEAYEGTVSGSDVRALIDLVRTNNNQFNKDTGRQINIAASTSVTGAKQGIAVNVDYSALKSAVETGANYTVKFTYYTSGSTQGYINGVSYTKKTN